MYGLIWRILPGPKWLRAIFLLIIFVAVVYALFTWVFPWIAPYMPFSDQSVTNGSGG